MEKNQGAFPLLKVLVTDGGNKNTLSILRHLDNRECQVDITTHLPKWLTLCSYSKYCKNTIKLNSDPRDIDGYAKELIQVLKKADYDVLIPIGLNSNLVASKYKSEIQSYVNLLAPDCEYMKIAANKDMTMNLASCIGVPIPRRWCLTVLVICLWPRRWLWMGRTCLVAGERGLCIWGLGKGYGFESVLQECPPP